MAVGLYFKGSPELTPAIYDEATRQLHQAGAGFGAVPGRTFHCAMETGGTIQVFDVGVDGAVPEVRGNAASDYEQAWRGNRRVRPAGFPSWQYCPGQQDPPWRNGQRQ